MKRAISAVLAAALALPLFAESPRWPFIVIRHTSAINARPDVFAQLVDCHRRHPGVCDEFWFAGGGRKTFELVAEEAARVAAFRPLCEETGIRLSYQQGVTLGHGVAHDGQPKPGEQEFPQDAWQVGRDGRPLHYFCPRSPAVLAWERTFAKTILSVAKPDSYWLDDDLRLGVKKQDGCFCPRCIEVFNAKTGGGWTRETLVAKLYSNAVREPVRSAWIDFNAESLALFAAEARKAADELKSPCRMAYQAVWSDTIYTGYDTKPLLEALSGPDRKPVGIRPGAWFYVEENPREMVGKCLSVAREAERCRSYGGLVASVCYEQETYPRHVLHKSPGAIMTECTLALASGCDSLSLYWYSASEPEPVAEYGRFLSALAVARPYFERLAASTRRTRLAGLSRFVGSAAAETADFDLRDQTDYDLACAGIPVSVMESGYPLWYANEKSRREMTPADEAQIAERGLVDVKGMGRFPLASRRLKMLDDIDAATGGQFPVRIDACRPLRILPRILPDGRLDSVTLINLSIGDTDAFKVCLRRPAASRAVWRDAKGTVREVPLAPGAREGEMVADFANLGPWAAGTLFLE